MNRNVLVTRKCSQYILDALLIHVLLFLQKDQDSVSAGADAAIEAALMAQE